MSIISVVLLIGFIAYSALIGQSQPFSTNKAIAEGKGLITVYIDGQKKTFATDAKTIGEALQQNGVELGKGDVLEPEADTVIDQPHYNVNVYKAYPAVIIDGETKTTTLSGYRTARQIVESAGIKLYPEDKLSMERSDDFDQLETVGQKITINRATPVQLSLGNKTFEFRTWQETVGGLLKEKGIVIGSQDELSINMNEKIHANMKIVLNKISQDVVQNNEVLDPEIEYKDDPNQLRGYQKVLSEGKPGQKLVSYLVNQKNGSVTDRQVIDVKIVVPAEPKVIVRGTKSDSIADNAELLYKLRMCETGGRYNANTGNGYYGAYQFSEATWNRWNTGYARADLAPPAVQDEYVIKNVRASAGGFWSQHPGCSSKLGLPKFPY